MTADQTAATVARAVSEARLWATLMDLARIGATPKGGVNRQALSQEDTDAKNHVIRWARDRGFAVWQDDIANLFIRREGSRPGLAPVLVGSHLDSQPTGGRFDGAYGVAVGIELLAALEDAGVETLRPVEAVSWTNEEGSRFSPGAVGSAVFAGLRPLPGLLDLADPAGVTFGRALADSLAATDAPRRPAAAPPFAYLEAHIEQGPILEQAGLVIGIVGGVQGQRRFEVTVTGEDAHAGTTPRSARKDALVAAIRLIAALQDLTADEADVLRFTVGRVEVRPGSPNTVPGSVFFTIDLRHPDEAVLAETSRRIRDMAAGMRGPCRAAAAEISAVPPTPFSPAVLDLCRDAAASLGLPGMDMMSGAGHDAMHVARICPAGMVFVPCLNGVSHNEAESARPEDLAAGARVVAAAAVRLAMRPD